MTAIRDALLGLALLGSAALAAAEPDAVVPAQRSAQAVYNDAIAAFQRADWPAAIAALREVAGVPDGPVSRSIAIVHAQLAEAYAYHDEADRARFEALIADKALAGAEPALLVRMWTLVADAERLAIEISYAKEHYARALAITRDDGDLALRASTIAGLARLEMTMDPRHAVELLDPVLHHPGFATLPAQEQAELVDLRGRASLNLQDPAAAMPLLEKAVALSGGMTGNSVRDSQIPIRGDASVAALMLKQEGAARRYLSYTGAGHLDSLKWGHFSGRPPVCGGAHDIDPDDMVIVEFSLDDAGRTTRISPIYATRAGEIGLDFARALRHWRWQPEDVATLPAFWRNQIRFELRCVERPAPWSLSQPYVDATVRWLDAQHIPVEGQRLAASGYVAADDPRLREDTLTSVPALLARLGSEKNPDKAAALSARLQKILAAADAPPEVRAVGLQRFRQTAHASRLQHALKFSEQIYREQQTYAPGSAATFWLELEYAVELEFDGRFREAEPLLQEVAHAPDSALPEHDPVREVAILHLSALIRRSGDAEAARGVVEGAGLTRAQCELFDVKPVVSSRSTPVFPTVAAAWGFDGFVSTNFDINRDGRTEKIRAIVAYPPFVFNHSAMEAAAEVHYIAPVIDEQASGCESAVVNFRYAIASRH